MSEQFSISQLPPPDRWEYLEEKLQTLDEQVAARAGGLDATDIVCIEELAEQGGVTPETMRSKFRAKKVPIFKQGRKWFVRKVKLLDYYQKLEEKS